MSDLGMVLKMRFPSVEWPNLPDVPALQLVMLFGPVWPVALFFITALLLDAGTFAKLPILRHLPAILRRNLLLWKCCAATVFLLLMIVYAPGLTLAATVVCSCGAFVVVAPDFAEHRANVRR